MFQLEVQEQIFEPLGRESVGSEHFHVTLVYDDMPLAVVTASEPGPQMAGSTYIVLVREYLKRELDKSVRLSCLGPSPFHGNFFLKLVQEQDPPLSVRREKHTLGYSQYWCSYSYDSTNRDDNSREALRDVLDELTSELTTFYRACRQNQLLVSAWDKIEEPVRKSLLGNPTRGQWRDVMVNRLRQNRSIRLVTDRLVRFEMDRIFGRQALEESLDHTYSIPGKAYLRDEVEKVVCRMGEYPIAEVYRLLEFLEGRRSKQVELLVVFIAAIVGGIVAWFLGSSGASGVS